MNRNGIEVTGLNELNRELKKREQAAKQLKRDLERASGEQTPAEARRHVQAAFRKAGLPVDKRILDEIDKSAGGKAK